MTERHRFGDEARARGLEGARRVGAIEDARLAHAHVAELDGVGQRAEQLEQLLGGGAGSVVRQRRAARGGEQAAVPVGELAVEQPERVAALADRDRLEDARVAQLLERELRVEGARRATAAAARARASKMPTQT